MTRARLGSPPSDIHRQGPLQRPSGVIEGLEHAAQVPGAQVFQAGTARDAQGHLVAVGGRVLGIAASAPSLAEARQAAYAAVDAVRWPDGFCRRDIGWRALN